MEKLDKILPEEILKKYEIYNYNHAAEILSLAFKTEFDELMEALRKFNISIDDIKKAGGSESPLPPKFGAILEPLGWSEIKISGDLVIKFYPRKGKARGKFSNSAQKSTTIENYIDGHNIDYVKGRVACDVEWNSKDQTFDRDLFAFRTYHECDIISVAVIITRSAELNKVFKSLGKTVKAKYGASTTWMGKLLPRLDSRRHGSCPVLAIGIKPDAVIDWMETKNE
jgi:hypothetical protein